MTARQQPDPAAPPPAPPRLGPRPLGLHLLLPAASWLSSVGVATLWKQGSLPWKEPLPDLAAALRSQFGGVEPDQLRAAVSRDVRLRLAELEAGIRAYRRHPYHRRVSEPPLAWRQGTTRLLDHRSPPGRKRGRPVLVVPSLINRAYILDLERERSFMRFLAGAGLRPFLLDWDRPGEEERGFALEDYVAGRLSAALDQVIARCGEPPVVIGYCMGGTLAVALAALRGADLAGLVLLAAPWDFHAERGEFARAVAVAAEAWLPRAERVGEVPVDVLQALFFGLDPFLGARKFRAFARLDPSSDMAREFVALEDWLNDGVPLAARVARECITGWYGENRPGRAAWRVAGRVIDPARLAVPSLVVVPERDRIVPPASAMAMAAAIPGAARLDPPLGHIGMIASARAAELCWRPLVEWLASLPPRPQYKAEPARNSPRRRSTNSRPSKAADKNQPVDKRSHP